MEDSGSLSRRRRALIVAHLIGWLAQGALLHELMTGTMFFALIAILFAFIGSNPVGQVAAGIVGVLGLVLVLSGIRAQWSVGRMWLIVAPFAVLEPVAASLAFVHS